MTKKSPLDAGTLHEQGLYAVNRGEDRKAIKLFRRAVKAAPRTALYRNSLGVAYSIAGENQNAVRSFRSAIKIDRNYAACLTNLAAALRDLGDPGQAIDTYIRAESCDPRGPAAKALGLVFIAENRDSEAAAAMNRALKNAPDDPEILTALGFLAATRGHHGEAVDYLESALRLNPFLDDTLVNLANALKNLGNYPQAVSTYKKAIEVNPKSVLAYNNLGNTYRDLGEIEQAMSCFQSACALDPGYGQAHRNLSSITKYQRDDAHILQMEQALEAAKPESGNRMHLCFGLGKVFDDIREYGKAFAFLDEGNSIARKLNPYDANAAETHFNWIKREYSADFLRSAMGNENATAIPIFIVGMPRSGTSLVEQIFASHPIVFGAGELPLMQEIVDDLFPLPRTGPDATSVQVLTPDSIAKTAEKYLHGVQRLSGDSPCFTDKMPDNFRHIGLIHLLFPNARIIHCTRNPVDTCVSIYKRYFPNKRMTHAFGFEDLGHYYALYTDLMRHWRGALPGFVLDIPYEELVTAPEYTIRLLLDFCGLDWQEKCLRFHETDRVVRSASAIQVRKPLYRDSVGGSQTYAPWLGPLFDSLKKHGVSTLR